MLPAFKEDHWLISRENRGYYQWVDKKPFHLERYNFLRRLQHRPFLDGDFDARSVVSELFESGLGLHPMLDIAFAAVARAEIRLSTRFIPQGSHEERLTGSLVSEIEAAIHLASGPFRRRALERYNDERTIDFIYYDLSQGGRIEKQTGADLGIILHIDLPDFPKIIRFAAFQAKKLNRSAQLEKAQFNSLLSAFPKASAYLFYDTNFATLAPPLVVEAESLEDESKEDATTDSFSVLSKKAFFNGVPLSLWLFSKMAREQTGHSALNFSTAIEKFTNRPNDAEFFGGRLAILSVGRRLQLTRRDETGLDVTLG